MGFSGSRGEARHLVNHGHFRVDGKKVTIPSYMVKQGQTITVREKSRKVPRILESMETIQRRGVPAWLELDAANFKGVMTALPTGSELETTINAQLIVELYSK
jgi:small subunit ribosomal protein S4